MSRKFIVSKRTAGLGDLLISLSSAWWYAKHTNRDIVADWRNSTYSRTENTNIAAAIFDKPMIIGGVRIDYDISQISSMRSKRFFPSFWNVKKLHEPVGESDILNRQQRELISKLEDRTEEVVVLSECLPNLIPEKERESEFFSQLDFCAMAVELANQYCNREFRGRTVVGVHVRHGNGGEIMGHAEYWQNPTRTLFELGVLIRNILETFSHKTAIVFLATDSCQVEKFFRNIFPKAVVYPKRHRRKGVGELHRGNKDPNALRDALVDMLLLARCHVLIRFPPVSFFTHYPSIVKPSSGIKSSELAEYCQGENRPDLIF